LDGAEQSLHGDLPHGPWSFVFSLTNWNKRKFTGGETVLLRDEVLDFWRKADLSGGMEQGDILESIAPEMNRLVVFDPRIPHGVRRVSGAHDVREGRLVIHGWFVNPRPYIEGPLRERDLKSALKRILHSVDEVIQGGGFELDGMVSFRFTVAKSGLVSSVKLLTHSLRAREGDSLAAVLPVLDVVQNTIRREQFALQDGISIVTLPLVFSSRSESTS
ncbi:MAG: 2OG-Fe(II) oxygenase, partial [Bdellovibrionales bacterium]|nr:2OG-Fe(II) oxygenase [Bdellovibrionales bacterium]